VDIQHKTKHMKTFLPLLFITVSIASCKKQVTENNISGTYKLDAVKEMRAFKRERVEHPLLGGTFVFNNAGQVNCITATDTLFGNYDIDYRNREVFDQDGNSSNNRETGLIMFFANRQNTNRFFLTIWNLRYRDNRNEMRGEEQRHRNNYLFEFLRQ
jgi:hypothetical protein